MEKIKINLDKLTLAKLYDDMICFNFYKKDMKINKNGFLNILIKNYFPIYDKEASEQISKCTKIVTYHLGSNNRANDIINDLIKSDSMFAFSKKETLDVHISFKPNNINTKIINIILNKYLPYQSLASFFRHMIEHYLSLPQYKREQIIFSDTYTLINEAIENHRKIFIQIKDEKKEVIPYKVVTNKEEIYNYLVCLVENTNHTHIHSFHLYKIDHVYLIPQKYTIEEEQKNMLDKISSTYPQFPYSDNQHAKIQLTNEGIKLFNSKYLNRPIPYHIENNVYFFDCAYSQLLVYFFSFGKEAKIIEPTKLKETFKEKYLLAYNHYND